MSPTALFDLNIEEVLEHWEVEHALRELIANALDEQLLTSGRDVEIYPDDHGIWHVRDFGRGLAIEHFTLNENPEKLNGPQGVIGKFGVGLKDALATLHRRGVGVTITSRHGCFTLQAAQKHGFGGISTLHVAHADGDPAFVGTDIALAGVTRGQTDAAKDLFLRFAGDRLIEETVYGHVLARGARDPRVYISGVLAAEEPNFLFSYNVTNLTDAMRRRLNRERLNVGRTTYAERVKAILKSAESEEVCDALADEVSARARGDQCDELQWIEIAQRALTLLHHRRDVAFVTEEEIALLPAVLDNMRSDGLDVVVVTGAQKEKLDIQLQTSDTDLRTVGGYIEQYNESFSYTFVGREDLTPDECSVFDRAGEIIGLLDSSETGPGIRISETMRVGLDDTIGVWDRELGEIVIKRGQLASLRSFAGTLLHEVAHARTGAVDATRTFESVLTEYLGTVAARTVAQSKAEREPARVPMEPAASAAVPAMTAAVQQVRVEICPHCGKLNRIPNPGLLACGNCGLRFEALSGSGVGRTEAPLASSAPSSGTQSFSGNGSKRLGRVNVAMDSTVEWTNNGGLFITQDDGMDIGINSQGQSGTSDLVAGIYENVRIVASGDWTLEIVPK